MTVVELLQNKELIKKPLLIFDGAINECYVDKETEKFNISKIMICADPEENGICLYINTLNADITSERLKEILKNN